jgi:hypothetical protein
LDDWQPRGEELVAAAEHAARLAGRYRRLADDWTAEACRLADVIADADREAGTQSGLLTQMADLMDMRLDRFAQKRRRLRQESGSA